MTKTKPFSPNSRTISLPAGRHGLKKSNFFIKPPLLPVRQSGGREELRNFGEVGLFILFCFIFSVIYHLRSKISLAQSFDSASYHIDWGNFNMTSGKKTSTNYQLTDTVGQNAPGKFTSTGYVVKSGFQYIYDTLEKFSFSISDISIDFGSLTPNVGSTQSNIITITTPSGHGYQVMAITNKPLSSISSTTIPNTNCDTSCSISSSGVWSSSSRYGFGFNTIGINSSGVATNIGTSSYFTNSTYFRPFAATSRSESPQIIMSEDNPVKNRSARLTYKINISTNQPSGDYENLINLIAVPKY